MKASVSTALISAIAACLIMIESSAPAVLMKPENSYRIAPVSQATTTTKKINPARNATVNAKPARMGQTVPNASSTQTGTRARASVSAKMDSTRMATLSARVASSNVELALTSSSVQIATDSVKVLHSAPARTATTMTPSFTTASAAPSAARPATFSRAAKPALTQTSE